MIYTIASEQLSVAISDRGAEVVGIWANMREYIWEGDPAFWEEQSPLLFPTIGRCWQGEFRHEGKTYPFPPHGFARKMDFTLEAAVGQLLSFSLESNAETLAIYPFEFRLEVTYRLEKNKLRVQWKVKNPAASTLYFQIGGHPGFVLHDFDAADPLLCYLGFGETENLHYIQVSDGGCANPNHRIAAELSEGLLRVDSHTFFNDALMFENHQIKHATLYDKQRRPVVTLHTQAPLMAFWSPEGGKAPFICFEPWYGRCDRAHFAGEFKDRDWMQQLPAGETFTGGYELEIH